MNNLYNECNTCVSYFKSIGVWHIIQFRHPATCPWTVPAAPWHLLPANPPPRCGGPGVPRRQRRDRLRSGTRSSLGHIHLAGENEHKFGFYNFVFILFHFLFFSFIFLFLFLFTFLLLLSSFSSLALFIIFLLFGGQLVPCLLKCWICLRISDSCMFCHTSRRSFHWHIGPQLFDPPPPIGRIFKRQRPLTARKKCLDSVWIFLGNCGAGGKIIVVFVLLGNGIEEYEIGFPKASEMTKKCTWRHLNDFRIH